MKFFYVNRQKTRPLRSLTLYVAEVGTVWPLLGSPRNGLKRQECSVVFKELRY